MGIGWANRKRLARKAKKRNQKKNKNKSKK
jgi:hypothetical protein